MERLVKIEAVNISDNHAGVLIECHCSGNELLAVMTECILRMNDESQANFKVRNGWWLLLNDTINKKLKERAGKQ